MCKDLNIMSSGLSADRVKYEPDIENEDPVVELKNSW